MTSVRELGRANLLLCLILLSTASVIQSFRFFDEDEKLYPAVGLFTSDVERGVEEDTGKIRTRQTDSRRIEERVYLNSDGTVSFECPKSVCGIDFYFGRGNYWAARTTEAVGPQPPNGTAGISDASEALPNQDGADGPPFPLSAEHTPSEETKELLLKDTVHTVDMTWLGIDEKAHRLAFLKNSVCGGLYGAHAQLPPATADIACRITHFDAHSVYIKRLESNRLRMGRGLTLAVNMSSTFALKARDRNWRRKLAHSTSLRIFVFLAQKFGQLKPNLLKTNPAVVINKILLENKHLFYPLTELCIYVKACETVQSYPERLLQGYKDHMHPDSQSYLQLPIYSHLREVGAEVAFPRGAPTIFQPRIYDGNIPVDRKSSSWRSLIFDRVAGIIQGFKGTPTPETTNTTIAPPTFSVNSTDTPSGNVDYDITNPGNEMEDPGTPNEAMGRATGSVTEVWKRQMYRTWHALWIMNVVAYEAGDIWPWVQHHKASTFAFPPWKATDVVVLQTTEAVPMRWRDLSPRMYVEAVASWRPGTGETQVSESHQQAGIAPSEFEKTSDGATLGERLSSGVDPDPGQLALGQNLDGTTGHMLSHSEESWDAASSSAYTATLPIIENSRGQDEVSQPGVTPSSESHLTSTTGSYLGAGHSDDASDSADALASELSGGCISYLTDTSFFDKFQLPKGSLKLGGPANRFAFAGVESGTLAGEDIEWKPTVIGSEVKCPPVAHPDTCGLTASFNRINNTPSVWRFERDEQALPKSQASELDYADIVWIFRGTFVSKQWLLNGMGMAVPYRPLSKRGLFHYGFTLLFEKTVRPMMERELRQLEQRIVGRKTPLVIVFSGHSLGAAMAQLSGWYVAKRAKEMIDKRALEIRTVTFGGPSWGNADAYEDLLASGVKAQELNVDIDPVGVMFGEEQLTKLSHKKPFLMKLYVEDMDKVEVASRVPGAPPFSGRIWTRMAYRPIPLPKRVAAMFLDLEDVDMMLLDPLIAHYLSYTAALTIMAGLLEESSYGSAVAAPVAQLGSHMCGHPLIKALKKASETLYRLLRRVEADRVAEQRVLW